MACERPDDRGRSLSTWDCREMARQVVTEGIVPSISPDTVRRILEHHHLKPWRHHLWLSPKVPRDAAFAASVQEICDLYTRALREDEMVPAWTRRPACSRVRASRRPWRPSPARSAGPRRARIRATGGLEPVRRVRHAPQPC